MAFALTCTNFHFAQVRLRLGNVKLKQVLFAFALTCTNFRLRRKLGCARQSPIKNKFFLAFALACTNFVPRKTITKAFDPQTSFIQNHCPQRLYHSPHNATSYLVVDDSLLRTFPYLPACHSATRPCLLALLATRTAIQPCRRGTLADAQYQSGLPDSCLGI